MGKGMPGDGLYGVLTDLTRQLFGKAMNPRAFRDGPAAALALEDPAHVGATSPILGHGNGRTAEKYYNQAGSVDAAGSWQDGISRRRKASRKASR